MKKKPIPVNTSPQPKLNVEELLESRDLLSQVDFPDSNERKKNDHIENLMDRINSGQFVQEAVRDVVFNAVKPSFRDPAVLSDLTPDGTSREDEAKAIRKKKKEISEILDNLDEELSGKSVKEVTAFFVSLLDIQGQLCLQKTEGVITVRTRLFNFLPSDKFSGSLRDSLRQEISLIFTPEEVRAIRAKLPDMDDDDPLQPFLTSILDQAYDVIQYSEMTGRLLLEMTQYFLNKLRLNGYGDTTQTLDFQERHERSKLSLEKAIDELRIVESVINGHLQRFPVLTELPRLLRALIQVKLGILEVKMVGKLLSQISSKLGEYARARSAVAFDFNRLPSYQHGVRLRQNVILNLHKDVIKYMSELFQHEFRAVKEELDRLTREIEAASETMQQGDPEYEALLKKKAIMLKRLEEQRRKVDIVRSQERLVNVQHKMIGDAIQRYTRNEIVQQKIEEQNQQTKIAEAIKSKEKEIKMPSRMVMTRQRSID